VSGPACEFDENEVSLVEIADVRGMFEALASKFDAHAAVPYAAPAAAPAAADLSRHDPMAIAAYGKLLQKATLLVQLQHADDDGSMDQLVRVKQLQ
jgi:hypothetical protein